ncbi:heavy metal transporter [Streptomyces sp. NPDC059785]|uniref:heavy metal transporter n=1 Tax=unclassified Streptomyces TaxID=2593676 RepID=UPI0036631CB4
MPEPSPTPFRRGRLLRFGAAVAVLLALAGYLTAQYLTGGRAPRCKVVSGHGDDVSYQFTPEQAVNAATISAVGSTRGMPERAVTIALATALQESGLRNIPHGDRDSLGLFQQRPSQGWGSEKQILDPTYAAAKFYDHLEKVQGYAQLPLTVAAQRVQRSGYPQAYAKHEPDATLLAAALTGHAAATLTCEGLPGTTTPTGGPDAVRAALARDFGREVFQVAGAEVSAGSQHASRSPSPSPSPSTTGVAGARTVTVPVPDGTGSESSRRQHGWELAHWAVANSSTLHITRVSYAGRSWSAGRWVSAWHTDAGSSAQQSTGSTAVVRIVTGQ